MDNNNLKLGNWGEMKACEYLVANNYEIRENNYRTKQGEIDIIACREKTMVFIEVKTRHSHQYGYPAASITQEKQAKIKKTASHYLLSYPGYDRQLRFDVITIILKNREIYLRHIKNAF